jgi:hypothetical protein
MDGRDFLDVADTLIMGMSEAEWRSMPDAAKRFLRSMLQTICRQY